MRPIIWRPQQRGRNTQQPGPNSSAALYDDGRLFNGRDESDHVCHDHLLSFRPHRRRASSVTPTFRVLVHLFLISRGILLYSC